MPLLSVVVPISGMAGKLNSLSAWVPVALELGIQVVLVQDLNQGSSGAEKFNEIFKDFQNYEFVQGNYGAPGLARNAGIDLATGEWIAFWDADDTPNPEPFLAMVRKGHNLDAEYCIGAFSIKDFANNAIVSLHKPKSSIGIWDKIKIVAQPGLWRIAFRQTSKPPAKFEKYIMGEDQEYLLRTKLFKKKTIQDNSLVYTYNINYPNQLTSRPMKYSELYSNYHAMCNSYSRQSKSDYIYSTAIVVRLWFTIIKHLDFRKAASATSQLLFAFIERSTRIFFK